MVRRFFSAVCCLICLLALLAVPCFASGSRHTTYGTSVAVCLSATADSVTDSTASAEEETLPPKYDSKNACRNIAITAAAVTIVVIIAAVLIRYRKGY